MAVCMGSVRGLYSACTGQETTMRDLGGKGGKEGRYVKRWIISSMNTKKRAILTRYGGRENASEVSWPFPDESRLHEWRC